MREMGFDKSIKILKKKKKREKKNEERRGLKNTK